MSKVAKRSAKQVFSLSIAIGWWSQRKRWKFLKFAYASRMIRKSRVRSAGIRHCKAVLNVTSNFFASIARFQFETSTTLCNCFSRPLLGALSWRDDYGFSCKNYFHSIWWTLCALIIHDWPHFGIRLFNLHLTQLSTINFKGKFIKMKYISLLS